MVDPTQANMRDIDAENLSRLLELELIQKRASWKQAGDRYRSIRAAGFIFLFILIVGCLIGGYFAFTRMSEQRTNRSPTAETDH